MAKEFNMSNYYYFKWMYLVITALSIQSCASILRSSYPNEMYIGSEPDGAKVYIDGKLHGKTPLRTFLRPQKNYVIELYKPGYYPLRETINSSISSGWLLLDILSIGYILPPIVDSYTGAWYQPKENVFFRELSISNDTTHINFKTLSAFRQFNGDSITVPAQSVSTDSSRLRPEPFNAFFGVGYSFPSPFTSSVPILPSSIAIGAGYRYSPSLSFGLLLSTSGLGKNITYRTSNVDSYTKQRITPNITNISVDLRKRLYNSPLYVLGGVGLHVVSNDEVKLQSPEQNTLPDFNEVVGGASFGMGFSFKGGGFWTEARYSIGFKKIYVEPYQPFSSNVVTLVFGYYFDGKY
ncbi:MAG: PEGA domain-containing protein [Ignavibacteria bacterium]|nr:PEGA domain-containing protein [Ignavibacteria bacterium]